MTKEKTSDAAEILRRRIFGEIPTPNDVMEMEEIHQNDKIAGRIYEMRTEAKLTQQELADLVGTQQSVISRLEDAAYDGHSLSMLNRVAQALGHRVVIGFEPVEGTTPSVRKASNIEEHGTSRPSSRVR